MKPILVGVDVIFRSSLEYGGTTLRRVVGCIYSIAMEKRPRLPSQCFAIVIDADIDIEVVERWTLVYCPPRQTSEVGRRLFDRTAIE